MIRSANISRMYNEDGARKLNAFATWMPRLVYMLVALLIAYKIVQFWVGIYGPHGDLSNILKGF